LGNLGVLDFLHFNPDKISFGIALLVGVVASLSTCLMVVGAVVISFSAKYQSRGNGTYHSVIKPNLFFHLGRWITFFVLGGVLGLIGGGLQISPHLTAWVSIILAVILIWLGLNIVGWAPSLSKVGIHLPKGVMKTWEKLENSKHPLAPLLLGGLSFFLPCGFTQSMQIFALASGSFTAGAYTLLFFAIGTTPVLLGLGIATAKFSQMKNIVFKLAIGLIVIVFALYTAGNGLAILGINTQPLATDGTQAKINADQEQVVEMAITPRGYQPNTFEIIQGVPVKWVIDGAGLTGCTSQIIVPDLQISKNLTRGENIIKFTPQNVGTLNFSCGMGMVRGRFIVKPNDDFSDQVNNQNDPLVETSDETSQANPEKDCLTDESGNEQCPLPSTLPVEKTVAGVKVVETKDLPKVVEPTPVADKKITEQVINMSVDGRGYTPDVLYIKANVPVKWVIDAAARLGCLADIKVDKYSIYKELEPGQNIIQFNPKDVGEIPFSCGMGMVWGKFVVEG